MHCAPAQHTENTYSYPGSKPDTVTSSWCQGTVSVPRFARRSSCRRCADDCTPDMRPLDCRLPISDEPAPLALESSVAERRGRAGSEGSGMCPLHPLPLFGAARECRGAKEALFTH